MTATTVDATDASHVDNIVKNLGGEKEKLIPLLQEIQRTYNFLPQPALERLAEVTPIPAADIMGVASFYNIFRLKPAGTHSVRVCHGTACHVKGAQGITDALMRQLKIPEGEDTDEDGLFTLEKVACLGCCTLAPCMQIGSVTYGNLKQDDVAPALEDFLSRKDEEKGETTAGLGRDENVPEIRIGLGSCCVARGSGEIHEAICKTIDETGIRARVKSVGCVGMCHQTPILEIVEPEGKSYLYAHVTGPDVKRILLKHIRPPSVIKRLAYKASSALEKLLTDDAWHPVERYAIDQRDEHVAAFLDPQKHIAIRHCGSVAPLDFEDYLAFDGFKALKACLKMSPEEIIEAAKTSGLRGRGGGGFSTGTKWGFVRGNKSDKKYVVCNGDEGDPGAFMDRMLLESYPLRVLEGMIIAAFAVGADEGILYIREEYQLAVQRIEEAIRILNEQGLLGENILGSGYNLTLRVMRGAGAFVSGEETALLASIEGKRAMPKFRPPFPAEKGLWGKPTLVNNVETFTNVPYILDNGHSSFSCLGTGLSKGAKVFALAGKIDRGGLIEVPMGISIRQIIYEIGGGVPFGKKFKAVQVGGPSGGCIPESLIDTLVDYEALGEVGAMMGSGGLVVLDEDDCMVDIARYFLSFTQDESCGRCTACRVGTRRLLDIMEKFCKGKGTTADLTKLEDLCHTVKQGSLCALGQTAPNPILTTLKYFRDEYEAHIEGKCPAGKCEELIKFVVTDKCTGCTLCAQCCPVDAIEATPYEEHFVDDEKCVRCGMCKDECPENAIEVH